MRGLKYSDVCLVPKYSEVDSRSSCDTSLSIGSHKFKVPIIPANMKSVINESLAKWMSENDYFYIMHRFDEDVYTQIETANNENWKTISFSIGVQDKDKTIIHKLRTNKLRVDFLTIDIAHGHSIKMKRMIKFIKENLFNVKIIAGNVSTPESVVDLSNWGADIVKVGIGQGSPCTTKDKTGFTMPMFTCVKHCGDCYRSRNDFDKKNKIPIIADGGIKCNGDISKALVAGADLVMAGSLFAACTDSPAIPIDIDGVKHKSYFGSASFQNKGHSNHIEGKLNKIHTSDMDYSQKLNEIQQDLQSAISYSGGKNLSCFKNVKHIEV